MTTARHQIPHVLPSQAQKHVTVNMALNRIDTLLQLGVVSRAQATPPGAPVTGEAHIVAPGGTGDWAGHDGQVAVWDGIGWVFAAPQDGWITHVADEDTICRYLGGWAPLPSASQTALLGINGTADAGNRLLVQSTGVLFNHDGSDQRTTLNKAAPGDDAAVILQTGFSSRALTGLLGNDDYTVKVSPNGASFTEALRLDHASGGASLPCGARSGLQAGLGDDTAFAIPVPAERDASGLIFVFCAASGAQGAAWYDTSASPASVAMHTGAACNVTTGVLTGTTGTNNRLTIAADVGQIHVENRLGSAQDIRWFFVT